MTVKSGRIKQYFEPVSQRDSNTAVFFGKMEVGKVGVGTTAVEKLGQNVKVKKSLGAENKGAKKKDFGHFPGPIDKIATGQPTYCPIQLRNECNRSVTEAGEIPLQNTCGRKPIHVEANYDP